MIAFEIFMETEECRFIAEVFLKFMEFPLRGMMAVIMEVADGEPPEFLGKIKDRLHDLQFSRG